MNVELKLSDDEDAHIIKNMWPLYQHEVSEFEGCKPNRHGLVFVDDSVRTLAEVSPGTSWWEEPEALFPYLILVDGCPAGFNLVAAGARVLVEADFVVEEFFVLHAYRGGGVAEQAAIQGFNLHRGKWDVVTWVNHVRAIAFWRRVLKRYSSNEFVEDEEDRRSGRKVSFCFDNARATT